MDWLIPHKDLSLLSMTILLIPPFKFVVGGGTTFDTLSKVNYHKYSDFIVNRNDKNKDNNDHNDEGNDQILHTGGYAHPPHKGHSEFH